MAFLGVWFFIAASLAVLAMTGGFMAAAFPGRYVILAAPLMGIAAFACLAALLYGVAHLSFSAAASLVLAGCGLLTIVTARRRFGRSDLLHLAAATTLLSAVAAGTICITTIRNASPSIFVGDGTDAMNYADVADWIRTHTIMALLGGAEDPAYEQLPRLLLQHDARSGAFYFIALIGWLYRGPSLFAIDPANAVAWVAALLGVAATFASRRRELVFIVLGLALSSWFDYSRMGYIAKLLNYPASLMLAGLILTFPRTRSGLCALVILTVGVALLHSAFATILILATVCTGVLGLRSLSNRTLVRDETLLTGILCLIVLATSGILSRFFYAAYPDWGVTWAYVLPRLLDLDNQALPITGLSNTAVLAFTLFSLAAWPLLALLGNVRRNDLATGLLIGPALLLLALYVLDARAVALQLIGFFYPVTIVAAALLIPNGPLLSIRAPTSLVLFILLAALVAQRAPRFYGGLQRYVFQPSQSLIFSARMIEELKVIIGPAQVLLDPTDNYSGHVFRALLMPALEKQIQWTERGWANAALKLAQGVPIPTYATAAAFTIVNSNPGPHPTLPVVWRSSSMVVLKGAIEYSEIDPNELRPENRRSP
jgi:hypothetical protein